MRLVPLVALLAALVPAAAYCQSGQALAQAKGCLGCHGVDQRVVGPGFNEVAAKYAGDRQAGAKLVAALREGKGHPMKVEASDAELRSLVQFVLAQGAPGRAPAKPAASAQALFEAKGCFGCHAIDKVVVGPAFRDIAAKYKGDKAAEARLFGALKDGVGHPMKADATEAELRTMVKSVLAAAPLAKPAASPAAPAPAPAQLDKSTCLGCHGQRSRDRRPKYYSVVR